MLDTTRLLQAGFQPYRKTSTTFARRMDAAFVVRLTSGECIRGVAGDYACISPGDGERWIVNGAIFERTYAPQSVDSSATSSSATVGRLMSLGFVPYHKHQVTWARKIDKARVIGTLEGDVLAETGDYLCVGPTGEQWPQKAAHFDSYYEPVAAV